MFVLFTSVLQIPPLAVPTPLFMTAPDKESPLVNCLFHPKDKLDVVHVEEGCLHHPCITLLISWLFDSCSLLFIATLLELWEPPSFLWQTLMYMCVRTIREVTYDDYGRVLGQAPVTAIRIVPAFTKYPGMKIRVRSAVHPFPTIRAVTLFLSNVSLHVWSWWILV
jgi:hypothetical protein